MIPPNKRGSLMAAKNSLPKKGLSLRRTLYALLAYTRNNFSS
jgi:hypothetical protein